MSISIKNGKPQVRWRVNGRQRARTFESMEEAELFDMKVSAALTAQPSAPHSIYNPAAVELPESWFPEEVVEIPTFGTYAREWFDRQYFKAQSTRSGRLAALRTTGPIDDIRLDELKKADIDRWIAAEFTAGKSAGTVRTYYRTIRQVVNDALDNDVITRDRLRSVRVPKAPGRKSIAHYVSPETARAIADAVPSRFSAFLLTEYLTGLRWSEVAALTVDSVRVWVTPDKHESLANVDDVAGLDGFLQIVSHLAAEGIVSGTKSHDGHTVPIDQFTLRMLADHVAEHGTGKGGLVFSSTTGGTLHSSNWSRDVTPLAKAVAGNQFTGHDLRHSVAHDIESLAGTKVAADLLGHSVAGSMTLSYTFEDGSVVAEAVRERGLQVAPVLFPAYVEELEVAA